MSSEVVIGLDALILAGERVTTAIDQALDELGELRQRRRRSGFARIAGDVEIELVLVRLKSLRELRRRIRRQIETLA